MLPIPSHIVTYAILQLPTSEYQNTTPWRIKQTEKITWTNKYSKTWNEMQKLGRGQLAAREVLGIGG